METIMTKLKQLLTSSDPHCFLQAVAQCQMQEYEEYFLFATPKRERDFISAVDFLSSPETFSLSDYQNWVLIAQTIDGDYLLANDQQTMILPVSLYRSDIEMIDLPIVDFFIRYDEGKIQSHILATKNG